MTHGPVTFRGRGVNPKPPDPGIRGRILLRFLRSSGGAWPPSRLIAECGLDEAAGYGALARLLELGLIERWSSDTVLRVRVTARGRRFRITREG